MTTKQKSTLDKWLLRNRSPCNVPPETIIPSKKRSPPIIVDQPESSRHKPVNIDEVDLSSLESDPGLRRQIWEYNPNQINMIRREYLNKGAFQPNQETYPFSSFGTQNRSFNKRWFRGWNEGEDCFVIGGFNNWKKKERLREHVGGVGSVHNKSYLLAQNLMNQNQHIDIAFVKQNDQERDDYRGRLETSVIVVRLLLELGIPFRGHDEKNESERQGNFLTVLRFLAENKSEVKRLQNSAPGNCKLIAPKIQKDIVRACAIETVDVILRDLGDDCFAILVDESRDVSIKEQMVIAIRYARNLTLNY